MQYQRKTHPVKIDIMYGKNVDNSKFVSITLNQDGQKIKLATIVDGVTLISDTRHLAIDVLKTLVAKLEREMLPEQLEATDEIHDEITKVAKHPSRPR